MTREEAIKIIQNEYKCVNRECEIERSCGKCPYMMSTKEPILQAYEMAIQALSQEPTKEEQALLQKWRDNRGISIEEFEDAMNALQEPCDDAISRKDIQDYIAKYLSQYLYEDVRQAVEVIDAYIGDMPTVTQKSGKWIEHPEIETSMPEDLMFYECSECGDKQCYFKADTCRRRFCGVCGAKMESEDKE